jgi:hypothetical protein
VSCAKLLAQRATDMVPTRKIVFIRCPQFEGLVAQNRFFSLDNRRIFR